MDKPHAPGAAVLHPPPQGRICLWLGTLGEPLPCLWCSAPTQEAQIPTPTLTLPDWAALASHGSAHTATASPPARAPTLLHDTGGGM